MPVYKYRARDKNGLPISGELEVDSEDYLSKKLEGMGYILIQSEEMKESAFNVSGDIFESIKKVKLKQLVEFSVQLSTLINAGLPLLSALEALADQTEDLFFKRILEKVKKDISGGMSFSEALRQHPKAFSTLYVSMIRAGEAAGQLDKILATLAVFLEKENDNSQKVKSAMMYPLAMFGVSLGVVVFLVTIVLPNFVGIFKGAGIKLPMPTVILLSLSNVMIHQWYFIIGMVILLFMTFRQYVATERGRYYFDMFKFAIPIFGPLNKKSTIARFARTFGTLLESSVPILQSLEIVKDTVNNVTIATVVENIRLHISQGGTISEQVILSGIFPSMVGKMIAIGESSGTLDKMLIKVADFYDSETENEIKGLTSILEPIMIVVMGGVMGVIVLSVMLPMFDMMKVAKK